MSLTASVAITDPTCPHIAPTTPACPHDGVVPGGGGEGKRSRSVTAGASAPATGRGRDQNTETWASKRRIEPHTSGRPRSAQTSLTR